MLTDWLRAAVVANSSPAGPTDPSFSSVTALLHGGGANNSTTITDSSPLAANWTPSGNAKISTAQSKWGGSSIYLDGTSGTYVTATAASSNWAFGTGDFTVEGWLYQTDASGVQVIWDTRSDSNNYSPCIYTYSGVTYFDMNNTGWLTCGMPTLNTWSHWAICKSGSTTRMYMNGTSGAAQTSDSRNYLANSAVIGASARPSESHINRWIGYIDDFRITKGVARYSGSSLTVPTAAFPDA